MRRAKRRPNKAKRPNKTKMQQKLVRTVAAVSNIIVMGWCAELDLNPELYELKFSAYDWSRVWLDPRSGVFEWPESPSMDTRDALAFAERLLPLFVAAKALAGESVRKCDLGGW